MVFGDAFDFTTYRPRRVRVVFRRGLSPRSLGLGVAMTYRDQVVIPRTW